MNNLKEIRENTKAWGKKHKDEIIIASASAGLLLCYVAGVTVSYIAGRDDGIKASSKCIANLVDEGALKIFDIRGDVPVEVEGSLHEKGRVFAELCGFIADKRK